MGQNVNNSEGMKKGIFSQGGRGRAVPALSSVLGANLPLWILAATKIDEEHDRRKGTLEGHRLVVQAPLVAQVALEVLLGKKLGARKFLEDMVNRGLCQKRLM